MKKERERPTENSVSKNASRGCLKTAGALPILIAFYGPKLGSVRCKTQHKMAAHIADEKCLVLIDKTYLEERKAQQAIIRNQ